MNDTELFPALKTQFEDPDSENSEMVESLFDHKESHHQDSEAHEQENAQNEAQVCNALTFCMMCHKYWRSTFQRGSRQQPVTQSHPVTHFALSSPRLFSTRMSLDATRRM